MSLVNIDVQLEKLAKAVGLTPTQYATVLRNKYLPHANEMDRAEIVAQLCATNLNPFLNHCYFMGGKGRKTTLAITYPGSIAVANANGVTGITTEYKPQEDGDLACIAIVTKGEEIFSRTEFLSENKGRGQVWAQFPKRMLGHRAIMSAIRCACPMAIATPADELQEAGFEDLTVKEETKSTAKKETKSTAIKITGTGEMNISKEGGVDDQTKPE